MNAEPDSDEIRLLGGHQRAPVVPGFGLLDCWRYAAPDDFGWTWDPANPHVESAFDIGARIDYVFMGFAGGPRPVRSIRVVGNEPLDGIWPSDHAAVLAELWFQGVESG